MSESLSDKIKKQYFGENEEDYHNILFVPEVREAILEKGRRTAKNLEQFKIDIMNSQDKKDVLQNLADFMEVQNADDKDIFGEKLTQ